MHFSQRLVRAAFLIAAGSSLTCSKAPAPPPPHASYIAEQTAFWSAVPKDALGGLVISKPRAVYDRARSIYELLSTGPGARNALEEIEPKLKERLGFDWKTESAWKDHGIDLDEPFGFVVGADEKPYALVKPSQADGATALIKKVANLDCHAEKSWLLCGDSSPTLAANVAESLWTEVSARAAKDEQGAAVLAFVSLERQWFTTLADKSPYLHASHALTFAAIIAADEDEYRFRFFNDLGAQTRKIFAPPTQRSALLGAAAGAMGVFRVFTSPVEIWRLAKDFVGATTMDQMSGAAQVATGLDLEKDILGNFSGEMLLMLYDTGFITGAEVLGTHDDEKTKRLVQVLGGLMGTAAKFGQGQGATTPLGASVETGQEKTHGRDAFFLKYKGDKTAPTAPGMPAMDVQFEIHVTSGPRAFIIAFDRDSREHALDGLGKPESAFTSELDPDIRALFASNLPMVAWGRMLSLERMYGKNKIDAMMDIYRSVYPGLPAIFADYAATFELIYDFSMIFDVRDNELFLNYKVRYL